MMGNRSYDLTGGTKDTEPLCRHIPLGPFGPTYFLDLFGWVSDPSSSYVPWSFEHFEVQPRWGNASSTAWNAPSGGHRMAP